MSPKRSNSERSALAAGLAVFAFGVAGCTAATNSILGISDDKLAPFTCQMIITDMNYSLDALTDADDYYDYIGLEIVFDMLGDSLDIYAASESGEPAAYLRSLADEADAIGDAYGGFSSDDFDPASAKVAFDGFRSEARKLSSYCE